MQENNIISIEDLLIQSEKKKNTFFCENFKIFPEHKEINGGFMFGIIELNAAQDQESQKIFHTITSSLKENYYQQILNSPNPEKLNFEKIFEFSLNKTNAKLTELIQIGQINLVLENLNYFICVIKPDHKQQKCAAIFSNKGQIKAFLIHKTKKNQNKIVNIAPNNNDFQNNSDKLKIFSAISTGDFTYKDTFIICTEIFNNFISTSKIMHIILNNSLSEAIHYFKNQIRLVMNESPLAYSAFIIKSEQASELSHEPASQKSITALISNTQKTEKLLTPSFALNFRKHFKTLFHSFKKLFSSKEKTKHSLSRNKKITANYISTILKNFPKSALKFFKNTYLLLFFKKKPSMPKIKTSAKKIISFLYKKPQLPGIIIITVIILVGILSYGLYWTKQNKQAAQENKIYTEQINNVKTIIDEAESSFIYKNTEQSLAKLQLAAKEISYLPQATEEQQINYNDFAKKIADLKNQLLNIEKIIPQQLVELATEAGPIANSRLLLSENTLFSYGRGTILAIINIEEKKISSTQNHTSIIQLAASGNNTNYLIDEKNKLLTLKNNILSPVSISFTKTPTSFAVYNNNIYALQSAEQQILKYPGSNNIFSSPAAWISELGEKSINSATSLSIDGSIYTLNQNGGINKFYAGKIQDFHSPLLEPEVTSANKIMTSPDTNSLFIFESSTKRIIILDKNGNLVRQLVFDSLPEVKDIEISNDGKTGYLLSKNKIFQFNL